MNSDVKTLDIERFEEDLGGLFAILGWIERRLGLFGDWVG